MWQYFTLRFLCSWRSGRGAGLGPGFDGRPVVTWSGGGTFLYQPRRTREVHGSTLVLQGGGREVWSRRGTKKDNKRGPINIMRLIWTRTQCDPARVMQPAYSDYTEVSDLELSVCFRMSPSYGAKRGLGRGALCSVYPDTRPEAGKLQRLQIGFCHALRATRICFNTPNSNWTLTVNKSVDLSRLLLKLKFMEFIENENRKYTKLWATNMPFFVAEYLKSRLDDG